MAVLGLLLAAANWWWVSRNRFSGAFDVDESGYLATALRFERALVDGGPKLLGGAVLDSTSGPLVPLMSIPLVLLGGREATVAQALQPLLHVVTAVAVAGITARLASRWTALIAGVVALALPTAIAQDRSYQYALGASAFLCLAVWALVASDRCRRTLPMVAFGACVGAMLLSRTMTIGFAPAIAVATLVVMEPGRRSARTIAGAFASAFAVAGIWWLQGWDGIMGYLQRSGYSDFSRYWGEASFADRFPDRWHHLLVDVRRPFLLLCALTLATVVVALARWLATGHRLVDWPGARREILALWVVVIGGYAALFSTANAGTWFDTPLQFVAIAAVASLAGTIGEAAGSWRASRWVPAAGAVAIACLTWSAAVPDSAGRDQYALDRTRWGLFYDGVDRIHAGNIDADPRLGSIDRKVRQQAAAEWRRANLAVVEVLARYRGPDGDVVQTVTGSAHLFNTNTLILQGEEAGTPTVNLEHPVTTDPEDVLRSGLEPFSSGRPRILVRIRGKSLRFPDDRAAQAYDRVVEATGWEVRESVPLPDGGRVEVLTHPRSDPLG